MDEPLEERTHLVQSGKEVLKKYQRRKSKSSSAGASRSNSDQSIASSGSGSGTTPPTARLSGANDTNDSVTDLYRTSSDAMENGGAGGLAEKEISPTDSTPTNKPKSLFLSGTTPDSGSPQVPRSVQFETSTVPVTAPPILEGNSSRHSVNVTALATGLRPYRAPKQAKSPATAIGTAPRVIPGESPSRPGSPESARRKKGTGADADVQEKQQQTSPTASGSVGLQVLLQNKVNEANDKIEKLERQLREKETLNARLTTQIQREKKAAEEKEAAIHTEVRLREVLEADLKALREMRDSDRASSTKHRAQQDLERADLKAKTEALKKANQQLSEMSSEKDSLRKRVQELERSTAARDAEAQRKDIQHQREVEKWQHQHELMQTDAETMRRKFDVAAEELTSLKRKQSLAHASEEERQSIMAAENHRLRQTIADLRKQHEEDNARLDGGRKQLLQELDQMKLVAEEKAVRLRELESKLAGTAHQADSTKATLQKQLADGEAALARSREEKEGLRTKLAEMHEELLALRKQDTTTIREEKRRSSKYENEVGASIATIRELELRIAEYETVMADLRKELAEAHHFNEQHTMQTTSDSEYRKKVILLQKQVQTLVDREKSDKVKFAHVEAENQGHKKVIQELQEKVESLESRLLDAEVSVERSTVMSSSYEKKYHDSQAELRVLKEYYRSKYGDGGSGSLADSSVTAADVERWRKEVDHWKSKYIESCVKVTDLIRSKRNLLYDLDATQEKLQAVTNSVSERTLSLKDTQIATLKKENASLESRIQVLMKIVNKLTNMNAEHEIRLQSASLSSSASHGTDAVSERMHNGSHASSSHQYHATTTTTSLKHHQHHSSSGRLAWSVSMHPEDTQPSVAPAVLEQLAEQKRLEQTASPLHGSSSTLKKQK